MDTTSVRGARTVEEARQFLLDEGWIAPTATVVQAGTRAYPRNPQETARVLETNCPPELRDRGIDGGGSFSLPVDAEGRPVRRRLVESAGHADLDMAAASVFDRMLFHPATYEGCRTAFWAELPFTFRVTR